jgi:hypothetical protein
MSANIIVFVCSEIAGITWNEKNHNFLKKINKTKKTFHALSLIYYYYSLLYLIFLKAIKFKISNKNNYNN